MDLRLIQNATPSDAERDALDALLGQPETEWRGAVQSTATEAFTGSTGHAVRQRRHMLLPALHAARDAAGYISPGGLNYICQRLEVPPAEAYGVASFYALFRLEPTPPVVAHVCDDIACRMRGALELCDELQRKIGPEGTATADGNATWHRSPCLGMCECAPVVMIQRSGVGNVDESLPLADADNVLKALSQTGSNGQRSPGTLNGSTSAPQTLDPDAIGSLRLLRRVGRVDPGNLDAYRASGGYEALRRAFELGPSGIIREVQDSRLQGRGGAAFPTGRKLEDVAKAPARPHYLIRNADESEPGTFKDRVLMEGDPFALVESMTIAGYAAGCERGYIYLRGEYPLALARLQHAIDSARRRSFLGDNIMDEGYSFDIEIRRGAGAYICGEETALFNSLEGERGEPRNKPPFPTQVGLFGKPTMVNNVETLMNLPDIVLYGGPAFASVGTEASTGTKVFCVSGCVERPGVYELPFGVTLRDVLTEAGGIRGGRPLQAVLLGGVAGSFVTPDDLDVELTFEGTRAIGASLGSAVVMPFDDTIDLKDILLRIAAFFRDESCGQCVPCRVGTVRQEEALRRLIAGSPIGSLDNEVALIDELGMVMRDASICGLGHTASIAVQSAIHKLHLFDSKRV
ncbi:MAG TPA: NAD(P)H-dependent oxidoreductase subunit E [Thermomicrobiales bacterium]|nr:NAD(P)H-dependent oxidoreductase subunit E [Thermomicrobiales bacterium]